MPAADATRLSQAAASLHVDLQASGAVLALGTLTVALLVLRAPDSAPGLPAPSKAAAAGVAPGSKRKAAEIAPEGEAMLQKLAAGKRVRLVLAEEPRPASHAGHKYVFRDRPTKCFCVR